MRRSLDHFGRADQIGAARETLVEPGESKVEMRRDIVQDERVGPGKAQDHQFAKLEHLSVELTIGQIMATHEQRLFLFPGNIVETIIDRVPGRGRARAKFFTAVNSFSAAGGLTARRRRRLHDGS
jgi:hypothetical protein